MRLSFGILASLLFSTSVLAENRNLIHPYDVLLLDLSESLKIGTPEARVDVADVVLGCSGFLMAMKKEISVTEYGSNDVLSGLDKMSSDMNNLSYVLMSGIADDVKEEVDNAVLANRSKELIILRANGLQSAGFVHRYKECQQVFYFTNYVLINGKTAASDLIKKIER